MSDSRSDVTPRTLEIETRAGRVFTLHEPSFLDIADGEALLEKDLGRPMPFSSWFGETVSYHIMGTTIWLAARKHGLTEQQIKDRQWAMTRDDLMSALHVPEIGKEKVAEIMNLFTPFRFEPDIDNIRVQIFIISYGLEIIRKVHNSLPKTKPCCVK